MHTIKTRTSDIPLVDPALSPEYAEAVKEQILSGFVGPGRTTAAFATELAAYAGVPYCLLTVSGTIALSVAAKAVGLQHGDEILVPGYGVVSTINAFASIGLQPKLVDIERHSGSISLSQVERIISSQTKAVCYVNFSGYTGPELVELRDYCAQQYHIPLIEDAAGALGQTYNNARAGSFGHVGTYSFSVPKVLTTGQGGALVTADEAVYLRAAAWIDQGDLEWRRTNLNRDIGTNLRFTDLQSALGLVQLQDIDQRLAAKRAPFQVLQERLGDALFQVPGKEAPLHNIVLAQDPDRLVGLLKEAGIAAVRQYRVLSQHRPYSALGEARLDNSLFWTNHAVYLPFGLTLTPTDAEFIADTIKASGIQLLSFRA